MTDQTGKKIKCIACDVFRMEIASLVSLGKLDCDFIFLDSMLHMNPSGLEDEMRRVLEIAQEERYLLLYGDCHPRMHEMQKMARVAKVPGLNCCEILLGKTAYRELQRDRAFLFLPEWTNRWREIFTHKLGFKNPEMAQAFMKEHCRRLVYLDTGVMPVPYEAIQEMSDFFGMTVEVLQISLDTLLLGLNNIMERANEDLLDFER